MVPHSSDSVASPTVILTYVLGVNRTLGEAPMIEDDAAYYRRRAEIERKQAHLATCPRSARAHSELANAYLERLVAEPMAQFVHV